MSLATLINLSPQARKIYDHMVKAGSISAREAMADYGIASATLARRICDLEGAGIAIIREQREHPINKRRYTRYAIAGEGPAAPAPEPLSASMQVHVPSVLDFAEGDRIRIKEPFDAEPKDAGRLGTVLSLRGSDQSFPINVLLDGDHPDDYLPVKPSEIEKLEG